MFDTTGTNWFVKEDKYGSLFVCDGVTGDVVASMEVRDYSDAYMMASSHNLYEALEWAMKEISGLTIYENDGQRDNCISASFAALAKAKGETQ